MAKQKAKALDSGFLKPEKKESDISSNMETPVAMTLKLPHKTYVRLKELAAKRKTKGQALMLQAVTDYLDRVGS
jgi:hypothetical protein